MGMDWFLVFYLIVGLILGFYVAGLGAWGLIMKRPLVFSARQLMWVLFLAYVPQVVQSFIPLFTFRGYLDWFAVLMPLFMVSVMGLLVFVFWRQMAGYMIFGIDDDTFRDALIYALNKLNLPFQERLSKVRLTELNADLYAVIAEWMGSAQIRMKQRQHEQQLTRIAKAMNDYYASTSVKVNNLAYVVYLLLGLLLIIFLIGMAIWFVSFRF